MIALRFDCLSFYSHSFQMPGLITNVQGLYYIFSLQAYSCHFAFYKKGTLKVSKSLVTNNIHCAIVTQSSVEVSYMLFE